MTTSNLCNLNDLLVDLSNLAVQYDSALLDVIRNYDSMAAEVEQSLVESRAYWRKFAEDERASSGEQAAVTIENIEALLTQMRALLSELVRLDKAFEKYYAKHQKDLSLLEEDFDENSDYLLLVRRLYGRLRTEANECSRTVKSFPFRNFEMVFSNKRKKKYADLIGYYSQAEQIANIACEDLSGKTSAYWAAVAAGRDEEIAKSEQESLELLSAVQSKKQQEIDHVLFAFREALDNLAPAALLLQANDYLASEKADEKISVSKFNSILPVGYYAHDFQGMIRRGEIADIMSKKLESLLSDTTMVVPAVFDASNANNFGIRMNSLGYEGQAKKLVLSLVFSMLANVPAGCQRFILMDPEERTGSFKPMLEFISASPEIMGEKILTTKKQMQTALSDLNAYIDSAAQRQFVGYANIYEYNMAVTDRPEAYRTLVIMDFPKYFDEYMLDSLWNIVNGGNPYGAGVILQYNDGFRETHASDRYYALLQKIERKMILFKGNAGVWSSHNNVSFLPLEFLEADFIRFSAKFQEKYQIQKKQGIPISKIIDLTSIGSGSTADILSIPFAIDETGGIKSLQFGDTVASGLSHYALVTGSLGSGKSTFLHTVVMSAIMKYSPDELNIYLMDFKEGTEFKIYAEKQVPHIKLLAMDTMQEFGQSILAELCAEMSRRAKLFNDASLTVHKDIKNIFQYRNATGGVLPRLLVILDEFQVLFNSGANRKVANSCGTMIADLVSLARVYGIHFIFATQTLSRIYSGEFTIQKATLNEMHVRIGLKGSEAEADLLFGSGNGKIAFSKYGEEKGLGAYVEDDTSGIPAGFRCAYCSDEMQRELLEKIADLYSAEAAATRVFSGSYVPRLAESSEYIAANPGGPCILLGEPIMIGNDFKISFTNKKRTNLLIVGSNNNMMTQLTDLSILGFLKFFSNDSEMYYFDGESLSGGDLPATTKNLLTRKANIHFVDDEPAVLTALDEVYNWYTEQRKNGVRNGSKRIFLFIKNLQWIDTINRILLGKSIDEYKAASTARGEQTKLFGFIPSQDKNSNDLSDLFDSFNAEIASQGEPTGPRPNYRTMLLDLMEFGYMYGVNMVLTASDFLSVKEYIYEVVPKFADRILFGLSDEDANRLIAEAKIQSLPDNIVLYTNGINTTFQFKPFSYET